MKLLPKQEINKAKAQERTQEIDSGLALAKKIDGLRELKAKEEANLKQWRESSIAAVQKEIDDYIATRENLRIQTEKAEIFRQELIKPLDEEWLKLNIAKQQIEKDRELIHKSKISLTDQLKKLKTNIEKVSSLNTRSQKNEQETGKAKKVAVILKASAQHEYEIARSEHDSQTSIHEKAVLQANELCKQYEVGITTNEIKSRILEEKESDLITREKELERRQKNLQIAMKVQKEKNDSLPTDN